MTRAHCYRADRAVVSDVARDIGRRLLPAFTQQHATHRQLLLREVWYFKPRVRTTGASTLIVTCCNSHLVEPGRQLRRIREGYVSIGAGARRSDRRGGNDALEKTALRLALVVVKDPTYVDRGLTLSV